MTEVNFGLGDKNIRRLPSLCFLSAHYFCRFNSGKSVSSASFLLPVNFPRAKGKQTIFLSSSVCLSAAMHQALDTLSDSTSSTTANDLDLIFLKGIMESPVVRGNGNYKLRILLLISCFLDGLCGCARNAH